MTNPKTPGPKKKCSNALSHGIFHKGERDTEEQNQLYSPETTQRDKCNRQNNLYSSHRPVTRVRPRVRVSSWSLILQLRHRTETGFCSTTETSVFCLGDFRQVWERLWLGFPFPTIEGTNLLLIFRDAIPPVPLIVFGCLQVIRTLKIRSQGGFLKPGPEKRTCLKMWASNTEV